MQAIHTRFLFPDRQRLKVVFKPCKELSDELANLLQQETVESFGQWCYVAPETNTLPRPSPLAVAHVLAGDKGPDVRMAADPDDASAVAAVEAIHKAQLEAQQTIVVRFDKLDMELVLVPVKVKTGQKTTAAAYWGYVIPAHLLSLAACVMHFSRLVVVFDLDETLLMAHTVDSLAQRIRRVNAAREAKEAELRSLESGSSGSPARQEQLQQLQAEIALVEAEGQLLQQDFEMLDAYRRDPLCRVPVKGPGGETRFAEPSWETVFNSKGEQWRRPVVRLDIDGRPVIITRINPDFKSTSVLLRPRPGWRALKDYLSGMDDVRQGVPRKQRWDVYICTTAEKEYALEAWRLLDHDASIFSRDELVSRRMLCVPHPQKKDLLNVLRWEQVYAQLLADPKKPSNMLITDEVRAKKPDTTGTAAMSVIIDDRADVWDDASKKALLQVMPFHPHKEAAALDMGPASAPAAEYTSSRDSEGELLRVVNTLRELRSKFYMELDHQIKPEANRLVALGLSEALQKTPLECIIPVTPMQSLLAGSSFQPPAALGLTEREDRASDLRLLANDSTMMTMNNNSSAAAATGNGNAPGAEITGNKRGGSGDGGLAVGVPVSDPRKRRAAAAAAAAAAPAEQAVAGQQSSSAAGKDQQQQQPVQVDFAGSIEGLLVSLQQSAAAQQQQQQLPKDSTAAVATGSTAAAAQSDDNDSQQRAAKKQRLSEPSPAAAAAAAGSSRSDGFNAAAAAGSAAATPGLNNSIGGTDSGPNSGQQQLLVQPGPPMVPPHPLGSFRDPFPLPGPPLPPAHVVAVLRAAAGASPSANDLAVYNDLFPAVLRQAATPAQLLEVLAALSAQYKSCSDSRASAAALKQLLGEQKFKIMQRVAGILNSNTEAALFFKPIMDKPAAAGLHAGAAGTGAAAAGPKPGVYQPQSQQQRQGGLPPSSGAGSVDGGSMGLQPNAYHLQQQQQREGVPLHDMRTQTLDLRNVGGPPPPAPPPGMMLQQQQQLMVSGPPSGSSGLAGPAAAAAAGGGPLQQVQQPQQQLQQQPQQQPVQQQGSSGPTIIAGISSAGPPTREQLITLNNDPDCFNYSYESMMAVSGNIPIGQMMQRLNIKNAPSLLADLAREKRGPRAEFLMFQGDVRPGQVQDLNDDQFTCVIRYLGKNWGYGFAPTKKGAKLRAADEAAANMYVSGIYFERLPPYKGPRPVMDMVGTASVMMTQQAGPGVGPPAAAGMMPGGPPPPQQQQQQPGGMMFTGPPSGRLDAAGQQQLMQQQKPPWRQQLPAPGGAGSPVMLGAVAAAGPGPAGPSSGFVSAEDAVKRQFRQRVTYRFSHTEPGGVLVMFAVLRETADPNSRLQLEAPGSGPTAEAAIEAASAALLAQMGQAVAPPQQQLQQQPGQPGGGWVPPGASAAPSTGPLQQQQQYLQQPGSFPGPPPPAGNAFSGPRGGPLLDSGPASGNTPRGFMPPGPFGATPGGEGSMAMQMGMHGGMGVGQQQQQRPPGAQPHPLAAPMQSGPGQHMRPQQYGGFPPPPQQQQQYGGPSLMAQQAQGQGQFGGPPAMGQQWGMVQQQQNMMGQFQGHQQFPGQQFQGGQQFPGQQFAGQQQFPGSLQGHMQAGR